MHPILFSVGGYGVRSAGVLYALAVIVAGAYAFRVARLKGWTSAVVLPGLAAVVAATYAGARLLGAFASGELSAGNSPLVLLRPGALAFFGGLIAGSLAFLAFLKWQKLPIGEAADAMVLIVPLLYAIFRLGCLLNGDDYGPPTSVPWGMAFPRGSPPTNVHVHPTPLYEILMMAPIAGWIWRRRDQRWPAGTLTFEVCVLMGLERLVAEQWRIDSATMGRLSAGQLFALLLTLAGLLGWIRASRQVGAPDKA